jgi:AraC-like DNA-binding protein
MSDNRAGKIDRVDAPQRVGPLSRLPALLSEFGVSIDQAIEGTDLAPAVFEDPESRIPFDAASGVLGRCATLTRCSHIGLQLGARADHRDLGLAGQLLAHAPHLEAAFSTFVAAQQTNSRGASVYLHGSGEHWVLGYGIYEPQAVAHQQVYALIMAMAVNIVRSLTQGAAKPIEVLLPFRSPDNVEPYVTLLGGSVRFDQPEAGIVLPRSALDAPVQGAIPAEFQRLRASIAKHRHFVDQSWTERVKHAMRPLILRGNPTSVRMASLLGVHVRLLSRRLEKEGTTFQKLSETVRYSMARELLTITSLTVGDIADALGYAHQSSFADAFVRWSGKTPSEWRLALDRA